PARRDRPWREPRLCTRRARPARGARWFMPHADRRPRRDHRGAIAPARADRAGGRQRVSAHGAVRRARGCRSARRRCRGGTAGARRPGLFRLSGPVRVLITRPRERALELARELERRGDTALIEPLLAIEPVRGPAPDLAGVQAIVLTSINAVPALDVPAKALPVFAVGDVTTEAAREAGCAAVVSARGAAT